LAACGLVHLVDDDAGVRITLERLLASGGYQVRTYASGQELLESTLPLEGACIILDVDMPGMDGFAVHRILAERGSDIPIVLITGSGDLMMLALKAGASDFLQKPFGRVELLSMLEQFAAQQRLRKAVA
jgi:two-component system response regulator FixJ